MKRIFIISLTLCFGLSIASAQNDLGQADDFGRIVLSPYVVTNATIPQFAQKVLNNKLQQIAAKNGVGGTSIDKRFVITANVMEMSKDFTATAPPMIALTLAPTIYIGDVITGTLYSSCGLDGVKGVGKNETQAYLNAIKNINVNNPAVVECINQGKQKIIEYYNSQIDFLIAEADAMVKSQQFDEAMLKLATVPDICKDAYMKAYSKIGEVYQKKIDLAGDLLYNEAYAQWNTAKTQESAEKVVELLTQINPLSAAAAKGRTLVKSVESHYAAIAARRKELEERNWAFKMQQYNDSREDKNTARDQEHDYRMMKASLDHEVDMEKTKVDMERAKNGAAELALQEVKGMVAMYNSGNNNGSTSTSSTSSTTTYSTINTSNGSSSTFKATLEESATSVMNKVTSWFK